MMSGHPSISYETIKNNKTLEVSEMDWKKVDVNIWLPTESNEELVGVLEDKTEGTYGMQYTILKEDGSRTRTPSHKVLQSRLSAIEKGEQVKIVYIGEEPPVVKGQNPTKIYEVYVKS